MSLKEAYTLAQTAQCRLNLEASRPNKKLRLVVGHLMHYESLRLRIVESEHDISRNERANAVAFKGTGHVDYHLQHKPSTRQSGRRSPPPPQAYADDTDSEEEDDMAFDDEADDGLSLARFPSRATVPQQNSFQSETEPPELESDDEGYSDDEELRSPEELTEDALAQSVKSQGNELYAAMYEGIRKYAYHRDSEAPHLDRVWELSASRRGNEISSLTRDATHISARPSAPLSARTGSLMHSRPQDVAV